MILAQAIENEDLNKIKIILENNPELVNLKIDVDLGSDDPRETFPLIYAFRTDNVNLEIIKYLLEHGADINSEETDTDGDFVALFISTPLEYALVTIDANPTENNILAMNILLDHGADPCHRGYYGDTSISLAESLKLPKYIIDTIKKSEPCKPFIKRLPKKFKKGSNYKQDNSEICSICFESIDNLPYRIHVDKHFFHEDCLRSYADFLETEDKESARIDRRYEYEDISCPICRQFGQVNKKKSCRSIKKSCKNKRSRRLNKKKFSGH